jgi:hypothetical protein
MIHISTLCQYNSWVFGGNFHYRLSEETTKISKWKSLDSMYAFASHWSSLQFPQNEGHIILRTYSAWIMFFVYNRIKNPNISKLDGWKSFSVRGRNIHQLHALTTAFTYLTGTGLHSHNHPRLQYSSNVGNLLSPHGTSTVLEKYSTEQKHSPSVH